MSILKKNRKPESNIDFEELFNSAHDAILVINPKDEKILEVNNTALQVFGYSREEFVQKKLVDISKNIEFERKKINEILLDNETGNFETFRLSSDKAEICLDVNASLISYKNEDAILQLCRDITRRKAFESALMESETKYRALYENYPLIHLTIGTDKIITSVNQKGAKDLGYEVEELIGSDMSILFIPQEIQRFEKQILYVLENPGKPSSHEMKMLRRNKQEFWVRETIYSSVTKNHQPQIFLVCDNITYQKNAEAEAKNMAQSLQNMLDASPLGVLVYRLDENNELIFISTNQSAINILNIDLYSLISKKIQDIFPALATDGIIEKFKSVISTGNPSKNQIMNYKDQHFSGLYEFSVMKLTRNTIAVFFTNITEKQKAINALTESELKFKTLFESSNDAIFLMKDDKVIDCNLKTAEIFGCEKEDIIGKSLHAFSTEYQPDGSLSSDLVLNKIDLALKDNPQFFEWSNKKLDGSLFYAEISLKKIEFHKSAYIQAIVRDITERKKSEKIISDQRRELATLMSNLPGMAYRCANNINWTMQFVSEGCYDLTGYKPEELQYDKVISYANLIHKDDRLLVYDNVQKALNKKESFTLLYRISTPDGNEKWVWEKGRGVFNENGLLLHLEGFVTDITERKISEEKVKILAHALTSVSECVCITDLRDRVKFINKSFTRVYGYEPHELLGKHISLIRSDKNDPEIVRHVLPETLAGGWTGELINVRKDGEEFPIHLSTSLILNEEGHPIAMTGVIVDITDRIRHENELKDAKERAEEASKLKTNFLTTISHELRTPLVGILGFAEIIKDEVEQPEISNMAQLILSSGKRLLETLNLVLDLSKIEANKLKLNYTEINLTEFIQEHIKLFDKIAADKGLTLSISTKDKNVYALLDEQTLYQILNNLIGNAIKYTIKGSIIVEVSSLVKDNKNFASIKIIDTGIGIKKEYLQQIFEEFRQVSEGLNRQFEGTGLGLTITKKLVEMMSGKIFVESEIGKGSVFTILFAASQNNKFSNGNSLEKEETLLKKNKNEFELTSLPEILMVENDFASREITGLFLRNLCKISYAETGEEAIEKVKEKEFKLILMDINLGTGLNGIETTKLIRKIKGYENVPVVALTAFAMAGEKEEFLRSGCTHYLSKPFQKKEIVNLLNEIV